MWIMSKKIPDLQAVIVLWTVQDMFVKYDMVRLCDMYLE